MTEPEESALPTILLDLQAVVVEPQYRIVGTEREYVIILNDGCYRVALMGGIDRPHTAAICGAQRLATGALHYAAGLAMLDLPTVSTETDQK